VSVWGHQNFRYIAKYLIIMSKSQRDVQRDKVAWEHVELPCSTVDWRVDFRHAPARRYEHVWFCMRIRSFLPADATQVRLRRSGGRACGKVDCERVQDRPLYSRINFKLNRSAALAACRQLLGSQAQAAPAIRCEFLVV
jgi:hypothetical protein